MMGKLATATALGLLTAALVATAAFARAEGSANETKAAAGSVVQKPGTQTIAAIAAGNDNFDTLVALLQLTGLDSVVDSGDVTLTVFAPTDAAFDKLFAATPGLPAILTSPAQAAAGYPLLKNVLLYHVTDGRRFSNSVFNKNNEKSIEMLNGGTITTAPDLTIKDEAGNVIAPVLPLVNISASNGVVHVIDTVMLPG